MATNLPSFPLFLKFIFFILSLSLFSLSFSSHNFEWWCGQTPYPDLCKHFTIRDDPQLDPFSIVARSEFRKMVTRLAMAQAIDVQAHNIQLGKDCWSEKERNVCDNCYTLYNDVILYLNKTLVVPESTDFDIQTWLSTALTNLDTCRAGFSNLGILGSPLIPNDHTVSKLISNALALSYDHSTIGSLNYNSVDPDGFPVWMATGYRRLLQSGADPAADLVVAKDGSGNFRTVKEAVAAAARKKRSGKWLVIKIKSGIYEENVEIGNSLKYIMLVGDGMTKTVITGSRSVGGGSTTFDSATFVVTGEGFIARDITFRNTAGPENHQAVALRSGSDYSAFYRCGFKAYQDTLYVHSNRQFYKECSVYGTVDFIFGNAAAVLQNCVLYARRPMKGQGIMVTAQGRTDPNQNTGISVHNSRVEAGSDLQPVLGSFKVYLGRPWKEYSRTVFMQTHLGSLVDPAGWSPWDGDFALKTLYYGEYRNTGLGAPTGKRVKWARVIPNADEALRFGVGNFIGGQSWLPATGIPFTVGL